MAPVIAAARSCTPRSLALIDGRVDASDPDLVGSTIVVSGENGSDGSGAHATKVASVLVGQTDATLGICRRATLLNFSVDTRVAGSAGARTLAIRLAAAIREAVAAGASAIVLTIEFPPGNVASLEPLRDAIAAAAAAGVRTIVPSGNTPGLVESDVIDTPGVVPVVMMDGGQPHPRATLGVCVARCGLGCPGADIPVAASAGGGVAATGSSYAAAIVAAAYAVTQSLFPAKTSDEIWSALLSAPRRTQPPSLFVPPMLDIDASTRQLAS